MLADFIQNSGGSELVVAPVAARFVRPGSARVVNVHAEDGRWSLRALGAYARTETELVVPLRHAVMREQQPHAHRVRPSGFVLSVSRGLSGVRALAVHEVGLTACSVLTKEYLAPGTSLGLVELIGDYGVMRHGTAVVIDSDPYVEPGSVLAFRARVRFTDPVAAPVDDFDIVDSPSSIHRVLHLASLLGAAVGPWRLVAVRDDELALAVRDPTLVVAAGARVRLAFDLFAISYEASVRVRRVSGDGLVVSVPLVLRQRRRRVETRARASGLTVSFVNPVTERRHQEPLVDLSARGLRFSLKDRSDLAWVGLDLDGVRIHSPDGRYSIGRVRVRHVAPDVPMVHCEVTAPDRKDEERVVDLLTTLRHPDLRAHDGCGFEAQLELYREMGLLMPFMEEQLASVPDLAEDWHRAHQAPHLYRTLATRSGEDVLASVSALLAWERTWLGQHLAARRGRQACTPGTLLRAFLEHVVPRPTCRRMTFFVTASNTYMNELHARFRSLVGVARTMERATVRAYYLRSSGAPERSVVRRPPKRGERLLVARAARRSLGTLVAEGLSLTESTLLLPTLKQRFERADLERRREIEILSDGGIPRYVAVREHSTSALCLPGLLNATWLIPLRPQRSTEEAAALMAALDPTWSDRLPGRLLLVPVGPGAPPLDVLGHEPVFEAHVYVVSRAGLWTYGSFIAEDYGERRARRVIES